MTDRVVCVIIGQVEVARWLHDVLVATRPLSFNQSTCNHDKSTTIARSHDAIRQTAVEAQLLLRDRATRKPDWNDFQMLFTVIKSGINRKL